MFVPHMNMNELFRALAMRSISPLTLSINNDTCCISGNVAVTAAIMTKRVNALPTQEQTPDECVMHAGVLAFTPEAVFCVSFLGGRMV